MPEEDNMTPELEKYYNNFFDLFGTEGWSQLIEELKQRESAYDVSHVRDEKHLYIAQGELSIIRILLGFQDFIEQGYEEVNNNV